MTLGTAAVFFAVAITVAAAFPIHASDALTYGEWSRLIAQTGHFEFKSVANVYNRPLFYFLEGWVWRGLGFSNTSGRLLCGLFSVLFLLSLAWLVGRRAWGRVAVALAVLFALATPVFAYQVVSTLTDVFVAALVALTAAIAVRGDFRRWWVSTALGVGGALAVLAKPNAIPALIGICAAQLLVRGLLSDLLLRRVLPIVVGTCVAFAYYVFQARHLHSSLRAFLESGVTSPYNSHLADQARRSAILGFGWFGDALHTLVIFTLVYTAARLAGMEHKRLVVFAVPATALAAWLLPWLGSGEAHFAVGAFAHPFSAVAWAVTCAALAASAWAPQDAIPTRRELAQLALLCVGPLVAWMVYATYDVRFLSPAWPGLLALMTVCALPAVAGLARERVPVLALAPIAGLIAAVSLNVYNLDGLGRSGWDQWRRTQSSHRFDVEQTGAIVLPDLSKVLAVVRPLMHAHDRLFSPEGAFRFFFPGRVEQSYPTSCAQLNGFRVFVLTTDAGTRTYMQDFLHVSGDPSYWAGCKQPTLHLLPSGAAGYAAFAVGS